MRKIILSMILLSELTLHDTYAQSQLIGPLEITDENYWFMIARSSDIYCVDVSNLYNMNFTGISLNEYYDFILPVAETLKGKKRDNITLRLYIDKKTYEHLMVFVTRKTKEALLFGYEIIGRRAGYYIAEEIGRSLIEYDIEQKIAVLELVNLQEEILQKKSYACFSVNKSLEIQIRQIINDMTVESTEIESFESLEKIGDQAVPYIILFMNDFRALPIQNIRLMNKSTNAWETFRQYAPYLVIDALGAILNQITGYSFGANYNGAYTNNAERQHEINGWRIYLYYALRDGRHRGD